MKVFKKETRGHLPEPELKRIPTGRCDSACYHIAKLTHQLYEQEMLNKTPKRKNK